MSRKLTRSKFGAQPRLDAMAVSSRLQLEQPQQQQSEPIQPQLKVLPSSIIIPQPSQQYGGGSAMAFGGGGGSTDLAGVYVKKCNRLNIQVNNELRARLTLLDRSTAVRAFDFNTIPIDGSFDILVEVLLLAASVKTIDASSTQMNDDHVDILVHHLSRNVGITSLNLSGNVDISDEGGRMLLDLANARKHIVNIVVDGTSICPQLQEEISLAVDENQAAASNASSAHHLDPQRAHSGGGLFSGPNSPQRENSQKFGVANTSFALMHGTMGASAIPGMNRSRGSIDLQEAMSPEAMRLQRATSRVAQHTALLCLVVLRMLERSLRVLCWENTPRSFGVLLVGIVAFFVETSFSVWIVLVTALFLQQRYRIGSNSSSAAGQGTDSALLPLANSSRGHSRSLHQALKTVRQLQSLLVSLQHASHTTSSTDTGSAERGAVSTQQKQEDALQTLDEIVQLVVEALNYYTVGQGRRRLIQLGSTIPVLCAFVSISTILGFVFLLAMAWHPVLGRVQQNTPALRKRLVEALGGSMNPSSTNSGGGHIAIARITPGSGDRNNWRQEQQLALTTSQDGHLDVPAGGKQQSGSLSPASSTLSSLAHHRLLHQHNAAGEASGQQGEDIFQSPFPFVIKIQRLVDIDSAHLSAKGFVPLVQVKYNRKSCVSHKVREPWDWDWESGVFCFLPGRTKVSFVLYDDATEMVGAVSEGTLILDDSVNLEEQIVVPLNKAKQESSLLRTLVDDVVAHERKNQSRHQHSTGGGGGGISSVFGGGGASGTTGRPGSLVVTIKRAYGGETSGGGRSGGTDSVLAVPEPLEVPRVVNVEVKPPSASRPQPPTKPPISATNKALHRRNTVKRDGTVTIPVPGETSALGQHRFSPSASSTHSHQGIVNTPRQPPQAGAPPHRLSVSSHGNLSHTMEPPPTPNQNNPLDLSVKSTTAAGNGVEVSSANDSQIAAAASMNIAVTPASPVVPKEVRRGGAPPSLHPLPRGGVAEQQQQHPNGYVQPHQVSHSPSPMQPESIVIDRSSGSMAASIGSGTGTATTAVSECSSPRQFTFTAKGGGTIKKRRPAPSV